MSYFAKAYFKSLVLRIAINLVTIAALIWQMGEALRSLGTFDLVVPQRADAPRDVRVFELAQYVFNETTILITLAGLMAVTVVAMLAILGSFQIIAEENQKSFRVRLFLYTLGSLLMYLALTTYLLLCVGFLAQTNSIRLNEASAFIWAYPTYAIVAILYVVECYGFLTKNHGLIYTTNSEIG